MLLTGRTDRHSHRLSFAPKVHIPHSQPQYAPVLRNKSPRVLFGICFFTLSVHISGETPCGTQNLNQRGVGPRPPRNASEGVFQLAESTLSCFNLENFAP